MKRYLTLIVVAILILTSGLVVSCSNDEQDAQAVLQQNAQAVFQKVDNIQVENFIKQQEIMDKMTPITHYNIYGEPLPIMEPYALWEYKDHLKFLREQYPILQETKYDLTPEKLDGLMKANLTEQQRLITKIEATEMKPAPVGGEARKKSRIREMNDELEFLVKQYQQFEELRDFLVE